MCHLENFSKKLLKCGQLKTFWKVRKLVHKVKIKNLVNFCTNLYNSSMSLNILLCTIAGVPKILSDFVPDNGLAVLASSLIEEGHNVKILDFNHPSIFPEIFTDEVRNFLDKFSEKIFLKKEKPSFFDILKLKKANKIIEKNKKKFLSNLKEKMLDIVEKEKISMVGFKLWAGDGFKWTLETGKFLKKKKPEIKIFGGGPQVDIFEHTIYKVADFFDGLCYGEGEETIKFLAEYVRGKIAMEEIPNVIFKKNDKIVKTKRKYIENLDELPIANYDPEIYEGIEGKIKMIVLDESRGCPNSCYFCIHPIKSGKRRKKSAKRIIKEIKKYNEKYKIVIFRYAGSNTPAKLMMEVAKELVNQNIKIKYTSFAHVKEFETDFHLLKRSGCEALFFGVESANEEILRKGMNKNINKEEMERVLKSSKEAGIFTVISLIYPAPFETEKTRKETIEFVKKTKPDSVLVQFPGIYPGTMWFNSPERFNFTLDKEKYPEQVMTYTIKSLFPPRFWDPLPYKINGLSFKEFATETENFQKDIQKEGIETNISDEAYLFYKFSPFSSLDEFLDKNRYYFYSGNYEKLVEEVNYINSKGKEE